MTGLLSNCSSDKGSLDMCSAEQHHKAAYASNFNFSNMASIFSSNSL